MPSLFIYSAGLDRARERRHAEVTLVAVPLEYEWNPFVVASLSLCLHNVRFPGLPGENWHWRQWRCIPTHTHTYAHTPSYIVHYGDIQSAVHIPPVCVFVFTDQTFLTPLLCGSLTRIFTVFAQVHSHSLPQSGCSALIIKEGAAASGAKMSASRRVRVQLQATK